MKKKYLIDVSLLPAYSLIVYTGLSTHFASKGEIIAGCDYHSWSLYHLIAAGVGLLLTIIHIVQHWQWYKSLFSLKFKNKSAYTIILSLILFIMVLTGVIIFISNNDFGATVGLIHNKLGLIMVVFMIIHIIGRFPWILKQTKNILKK